MASLASGRDYVLPAIRQAARPRRVAAGICSAYQDFSNAYSLECTKVPRQRIRAAARAADSPIGAVINMPRLANTAGCLTEEDGERCGLKWCPVPDYEGLYEVSNWGDVWSIPRRGRRGRLLAQSPRKDGYRTVGLSRDGVEKTHLVHILVMRAFAGEPPPGMQTRHLDGNPANNTWPGNLAYGTPPQNGQDKIAHGTAAAGERNGRHKLTASDVRELRRRHGDGESVHSLSRRYGVSRPMVRRIVSGNAWRSEFNAAPERRAS